MGRIINPKPVYPHEQERDCDLWKAILEERAKKENEKQENENKSK